MTAPQHAEPVLPDGSAVPSVGDIESNGVMTATGEDAKTRAEAVHAATSSIALEGFALHTAVEYLNAQYVAGVISQAEHLAAIQRLCKPAAAGDDKGAP